MKNKLITIILCVAVALCCTIALSSCNGQGCDHAYGEWVADVSASCSEGGVLGHYTCEKCGKHFDSEYNELTQVILGALSHEYDGINDADCNLCGEKRDVSKDILSVSVTDTTATIQYANGSVEKLQLNSGSASCGHKSAVTYELEIHTQSESGLYLDMCDECGMLKVTEEIRHSYGDAKLVLDPGKNICLDGAVELQECTVCGYTDIITVAPATNEGIDGCHTVNDWALTLAPTYLETGRLDGTCSVCRCNVSYTLPVVNADDYSITVINPKSHCGADDGVAECIFAAGNETAQEFVFSVAILPSLHTLGGIEIDPELKYDVNTPGINEWYDAPVECGNDNAMASFVCDTCYGEFDINVYRQHTVTDWTVTVHPTCDDKGERQGVCVADNCGKNVVEEIDSLGHNYVYGSDFSYEEVDGRIVSITVFGACSRVNGDTLCGHETSYTCLAENAEYTHIEPDCETDGADIYAITLPDNTVFQAIFPIAHFHHSLEGVTLPDLDTVFDIDDYPVLFSHAPESYRCGEEFEVYFTCERCLETLTANVNKQHTYDDNAWEITIPASCHSDGERINRCTSENCAFVYGEGEDAVRGHLIVEAIPAGHVYEYSNLTLIDKDAAEYEIYAECTREGCGYSDVFSVVDPEISETLAPTCTDDGILEYVFVIEGNTVTYNVAISKIGHHLNGIEMNNDYETPYIFESYEGLREFANKTVTCRAPEEAWFVCDDCEQTVIVLAQRSHTVLSYGWTVTSDPSCTEPGERSGLCIIDGCGATVTEQIAPLGHKHVYALDEQTGVLTVTCSDCDYEFTLTEVSVKITKPATCTSVGTKTYTGLDADLASVTVTEYLPVIAHTVSGVTTNEHGYYPITDGVVILFADEVLDCHSTAKGYYVCEGCGERISVTVYQPHVFADPVITKIPTCTDGGIVTSVCLLCEDEANEPLAPLGHSYEFTISEYPTFDKEGTVIGVCVADGCGYVATPVALPALNSEDYELEHTVAPGCTASGIDTYSYSFPIDNVYYTVDVQVEIDSIDHNKGDNEDFAFVHEEEISFTTIDGANLTECVTVTYTVYECDNEGCNVHILVSKVFTFEGVSYEYDDATDSWVAVADAE